MVICGEAFSRLCRHWLYICEISIALVFHSFDPALGLTKAGAQCAPYNVVRERNRSSDRIGSSRERIVNAIEISLSSFSRKNSVSGQMTFPK